jgi:glutamate-1-semialdehyde aminotransferase
MKETAPLNLEKSFEAFERAHGLTPGGVLGIRRPYNFVEGEFPIFFERGHGARVVDVDGNEYIDYLCAYGPIILGYREKEVDDAVIEQIRDKGFCFSLAQVHQNQLAEKLRELIPCAEMSLFVKTGSDATTCAVRLARAHTDRVKVMRCGYHGWHDWCVEVKGGIPPKLYEDVFEFEYNDLDGLRALMEQHGSETAAIIITPFGHPLAHEMASPKEGFLEGVRVLADQFGAVLIYDEIRTGFRMSLGGAQRYYGVTPDLAAFGKAMANGYAISAVCGKREIMKQGEKKVFISSTFFPNSLGYVAALKTIEILERDNVLEAVWDKGRFLMEGIQKALDEYPVGAALSGIPPMFFITFQKDPDKAYKGKRQDFYTQLIRQGVFLQPYHHGYVSFRHTQEDLAYTIEAVEKALAFVAKKYGK